MGSMHPIFVIPDMEVSVVKTDDQWAFI